MFETYDATKRCEKPGPPARLTIAAQHTWDANERIAALTAERDALLVEVAPLRELRAEVLKLQISPRDIAFEYRANPESLQLNMWRVDSDSAKTVARRLIRCLLGEP
jgi:hypothetical protein